ncbi:MAG: alkaline phosphatase family protein, partial [Pseudomonadota bacterium]
GAYETSDYYLDAYPDWVIDWNSARKADSMIGQAWELSEPRDSYLLAGQDDRSYEVDLDGFGRTFPHPYGAPEDGLYYTQILFSPPGDALTADFAKAAVAAEGLGQDAIPDFLSVSFAGVDGSQHFFGPSSLESEELVRGLDRTLADLFAFLHAEVGEEHILYVLSADHGMPEFPEYMAEQGMETHRTFSEDLVADLDDALSAEFGNLGLLDEFYRPYLYLNDAAIAAAGLEKDTVAEFIVETLKAQPGISMAVPRASLREQEGQAVVQQIWNNLHPVRSGDIYVAPASYSFLFEKGAVALMHGSPWRYDTHVPVIFAGPGIKAQRVARRVSTTDVAVTLAAILGTTQPSGASGSVLPEALP